VEHIILVLLRCKDNLISSGFEVTTTNVLKSSYTGSYLSAVNGDDYIEFYWLESQEAVIYYSSLLEEAHPSHNKLVSMVDDEKFGTFVFCASNKGYDASGIRIVSVQVKI